MKQPLVIAFGLLCLCKIVEAGDLPALEALVTNSFSNDLASLMLPLQFMTPSSAGGVEIPVTLVDGRYCGSPNKKSTAIFLGILYPGQPPKERSDPSLRDEDCQDSSTIANTILAGPDTPDWIALVELEARWKPWQLELTPTKIRSVARRSGHPPPRFELPSKPIRIYKTSGISIQTENGKTVPLQVAVGLGDQAFLVAALVTDDPPAVFVPSFKAKLNKGDIPSATNAILTIPHTAANKILNEYLASQMYEINLLDFAPTLIVKNPAVTGSRDTYITTSLLGIRDHPEAFNLELEWKGQDLQLTRLSIKSRHGQCRSTDLVCRGKKAGLEALATSLTGLFSARYKDIPLRSIDVQNIYPVKVDDKEARLHVEVLRSESTETDLVLYATVKMTVP